MDSWSPGPVQSGPLYLSGRRDIHWVQAGPETVLSIRGGPIASNHGAGGRPAVQPEPGAGAGGRSVVGAERRFPGAGLPTRSGGCPAGGSHPGGAARGPARTPGARGAGPEDGECAGLRLRTEKGWRHRWDPAASDRGRGPRASPVTPSPQREQ